MKILFVTEYYYPYIHGGAEISVFQLAKKLRAVVLTPKYGQITDLGDVVVERFPWPVKLREFSSQLSPVFFANPITWLYLTIIIIWKNQKIKADIFHCQSVNSFPGVWLASKILGKKTVLSIRDNQILCNYGWCLSKNNGKACNFKDYFIDDFRQYYKDKVKNKNVITLIINILFAINGRLRCSILKFFANLADEKICGSYSQQETLSINGISANVIYNIFEFTKPVVNKYPKKIVLYATKLSSGKGLDLLLHSWVKVNQVLPNFKLKIIGNGDASFYENLANKLDISKTIVISPRMGYQNIQKIRQSVFLEVTPSIYPESFGRTTLEAIALGVPVIATNRGGLKEIVEDGVTGYVVDPDEKQLSDAIIKGINNNKKLRRNIITEYLSLKRKFETEPVKKYLDLYRKLI